MNPEAGKIKAVNESFCAAVRKRDAAAMGALYSPTARLLPPGADFVDGPAAIQAFWAAVLQMGITDANLESVDIEFLGDTAIETGRYQLGTGSGIVDHGKYIVVWKNDHGTWKLHRDVWNSSVPGK